MLHALHLAALGLVACLSVVCLGISAHAVNFSIGEFDIPADSFDRFALATSIITLLAAIPLILLNALRVSMLAVSVAVELGALFVLWIFWLAIGAYMASSGLNHVNCSIFTIAGDAVKQHPIIDIDPSVFHDLAGICREFKVLEALAWINWILLIVAFGGIIALVFIEKSKSGASWRTPVHELFARPTRSANDPMIPSPTVGRVPFEDRKESFAAPGPSQPEVAYRNEV